LLVGASAAMSADGSIPSDCIADGPTSAFESAISACTAAIDASQATDADLAEMYRRRGVALWRFRDYQAGLNDIDRALAMKPDWPLALTDRGRALMRLNRVDEAAESFVNALKIDPDFLPGHTGLGWVYSNYNDKEGQLREYSRAVEIDPSDPKALVGRAMTNYELDRPIEALHDLDKVLALDPKKLENVRTMVGDDWNMAFPVELQIKRGVVLKKLGRFDEAIQTYRAILEDYPAESGASLELSELLLIEPGGDKPEALAILVRAAEKNPNEWRIRLRMSEVQVFNHDEAGARATLGALKPPADVHGELVNFYKGRSHAYRVLHDYDAAISDILAGANLDRGYLTNVLFSMRKNGFYLDLAGVSTREQFTNGLQGCVRHPRCAYFEFYN
jgi:tetratricopeptide (TPR) repeat protein